MSLGPRRLVTAAYAAAALGAVVTIAVSRFGRHPGLLEAVTAEGGPFETATAAVLILLGCWSAWQGRGAWRLAGLLFVVAGLEELSWGQHLLGFDTPGWLADRNYQGEANLHNLIDSELFSALLLVPIHLALVVVPLLLAVAPAGLRRRAGARLPPAVLPGPHTSLIFCFGWGLHAWGVPAAMPDSAALLAVLSLAGLACVRAPAWRDPAVRAHWGAVCAATALFAASSGIYRYYNMQYEMRELFVALGLAAWLTGVQRPSGVPADHKTKGKGSA